MVYARYDKLCKKKKEIQGNQPDKKEIEKLNGLDTEGNREIEMRKHASGYITNKCVYIYVCVCVCLGQ